MIEDKNYEVVVRKRVPYLTVFFHRLSIFFALCFFIAWIFMLPAQNAPDEMALAYFNLVLPQFIQKCIAFSFLGMTITTVMYLKVRLYRSAVVNFNNNEIRISGDSINIVITPDELKKVTFMDESREAGEILREKFTVYFDMRYSKAVRLRLVHYIQSQEFTDEFLRYEHVNYEFSNVDFIPGTEQEI